MPEFDAAMARLKPKRPRKDLSSEEEARLTESVNEFIIKMEAAAELGMRGVRRGVTGEGESVCGSVYESLRHCTRSGGEPCKKACYAQDREPQACRRTSTQNPIWQRVCKPGRVHSDPKMVGAASR